MSDTDAQQTFTLPTQMAVERFLQMKVEAILNTEYQVTGEKTPLAHCLEDSEDPEETVALLGLPEEQAEIAIDLLEEALEGAELEEVYGLRGGVLNVLMPMIHEEQDALFQLHDSDAEGAPSAEEFAQAPNELFSGLTPAQVWAGTGKIEMAMAEAILPQLWSEMKDKEFPTPGAANTEWLSRLRLWSYNPAQNYRGRIIDIILLERNENLRKRCALHEARDQEVLFKPEE